MNSKITTQEFRWLFYGCFVTTLYTLSRGLEWFLFYLLVMGLSALYAYRQAKQLSRLLGNVSVAIVLVLTAFQVLFVFDVPAYAIFDNLEGFLLDAFPIAATLVTFIFNAITFLLVIYYGIALVAVVRAITNGDSLVNAIQTPAIMTVVIVLAELTTTFLLE